METQGSMIKGAKLNPLQQIMEQPELMDSLIEKLNVEHKQCSDLTSKTLSK